jgi:hypothetical protein
MVTNGGLNHNPKCLHIIYNNKIYHVAENNGTTQVCYEDINKIVHNNEILFFCDNIYQNKSKCTCIKINDDNADFKKGIDYPDIGATFCVFNNIIYALGGCQYDRDSPGGQVFKLINNEWTLTQSMQLGRHFFDAAVVNNRLYVVGGYNTENNCDDNIDSCNTIEYYEEGLGWVLCNEKMKFMRHNHKLAVLGNKLLIIGGFIFDENNKLVSTKTVEIFDCVNEKFEQTGDLNKAYDYIDIIMLNEKIICIGSILNEKHQYIKCIPEIYDPILGVWSFWEEYSDIITKSYMIFSSSI